MGNKRRDCINETAEAGPSDHNHILANTIISNTYLLSTSCVPVTLKQSVIRAGVSTTANIITAVTTEMQTLTHNTTEAKPQSDRQIYGHTVAGPHAGYDNLTLNTHGYIHLYIHCIYVYTDAEMLTKR